MTDKDNKLLLNKSATIIQNFVNKKNKHKIQTKNNTIKSNKLFDKTLDIEKNCKSYVSETILLRESDSAEIIHKFVRSKLLSKSNLHKDMNLENKENKKIQIIMTNYIDKNILIKDNEENLNNNNNNNNKSTKAVTDNYLNNNNSKNTNEKLTSNRDVMEDTIIDTNNKNTFNNSIDNSKLKNKSNSNIDKLNEIHNILIKNIIKNKFENEQYYVDLKEEVFEMYNLEEERSLFTNKNYMTKYLKVFNYLSVILNGLANYNISLIIDQHIINLFKLYTLKLEEELLIVKKAYIRKIYSLFQLSENLKANNTLNELKNVFITEDLEEFKEYFIIFESINNQSKECVDNNINFYKEKKASNELNIRKRYSNTYLLFIFGLSIVSLWKIYCIYKKK